MKGLIVRGLLGLAAGALVLIAVPREVRAGTVLSDGFYSGSIQTTTAGAIPLEISLNFTDQEIPGDPDEILPYKKLLLGSFLLAGEAGPWSFNQVSYDLTTGDVEFSYSRQGPVNGMAAGAAPAAGSAVAAMAPSLLFSGKVGADGSISGVVSSQRGQIGRFHVSPNRALRQLTPHPKTVGHWKGTWTYPDGSSSPFDLYLDASSFSTPNPSDMELAFTPGRIGSAQFGTLNVAFSMVVIDYFQNSIQMSYTNPQGGGSLTLVGKINGDEIAGVGNSSFRGRTGTFKLRRVQ